MLRVWRAAQGHRDPHLQVLAGVGERRLGHGRVVDVGRCGSSTPLVCTVCVTCTSGAASGQSTASSPMVAQTARPAGLQLVAQSLSGAASLSMPSGRAARRDGPRAPAASATESVHDTHPPPLHALSVPYHVRCSAFLLLGIFPLVLPLGGASRTPCWPPAARFGREASHGLHTIRRDATCTRDVIEHVGLH